MIKHYRLDKRHSGASYFTYAAEFNLKTQKSFCDIREWCWEQWGPSCELEFWRAGNRPAWCWINDQNKMRIYFSTDKEYQWFLLRWGT
jgi:hypothetical protein